MCPRRGGCLDFLWVLLGMWAAPREETAFHLFLQFSGPNHLDLGDAIPMVAYVSTISNLFGIISVSMEDYSTQMV